MSEEYWHTIFPRVSPWARRVADQIGLSERSCMCHEPPRGRHQGQTSKSGIALCITARRERTTRRYQQLYRLVYTHRREHAQVEARRTEARDQQTHRTC